MPRECADATPGITSLIYVGASIVFPPLLEFEVVPESRERFPARHFRSPRQTLKGARIDDNDGFAENEHSARFWPWAGVSQQGAAGRVLV
jgi:hypothetical protein